MAVLELFQRADVAKDPVLGVFAYRAGVEQDEVRFLHILGKAVARLTEHPLDALAVGDILLTAVGADICQGSISALADAHQLGDQVQIFHLTVGYLDGFRQTVFLR